MSLDFSAFLNAAEGRTRQVRAWRTTGIVTAILGALSFAVAGLAQLAGLRFQVPLAFGLVSTALVLAIVSYVVAYTRSVDVSKLLLHLDDSLGLDERLSALYELRRRGGTSIFRRRLEARLTFGTLDWKGALPIPAMSILVLSIGLLLLVGTLGVAAWGPSGPSPQETPIAAAPKESEGSAESEATSQEETSSGTVESLSEPQTDPAGDVPDPEVSPDQDFSLSDVLADLQVRETSDAVVGEAPQSDLQDLADQQAEAARRLSEMLESIRQRLEEEGGGLTPQEQEQIRQEMPSASPQMQQALSDLLDETDPDAIQDMVSQLLGNQQPNEAGDEEQESTLAAVPDDAGDPFERPEGEDDPQSGEGENGEGQPEEGPGMSGSPGGEDGTQDEGQSFGPGGEEESEGGDEGSAAASGQASEDDAGFVRETVEGSIGDTGEITEFITAGVPLESMPDEGRAATSAPVSFDLIRSILESRDLTPEAREAVRAYFEAISQGGS